MGSSRLPGKILRPLLGRPMLAHVIERTARAARVEAIVVATSTQADDDPVPAAVAAAAAGLTKDVLCVRGSEDDVLARFVLAASQAQAGTVVRITGDCPLIDWDTIDQVLECLEVSGADYVGAGPATGYPRGLDCEAMRRAVLDRAAAEATDPADREHVTRYIYTNLDRFRIQDLTAGPAMQRPYRLCVDEADDFLLVETLYRRLWNGHPIAIRDVLDLLDGDPALAGINLSVQQKAH
jgi:spore coat polysaccharide biosynthesis protein SpsF